MNQAVKHPSIDTTPSRRHAALALAALSLAAFPGAGATPPHALEDIRATVVAFVESEHVAGGELSVRPDALDQRLRLARCAEALEAYWAPGSSRVGRATVGVRCRARRPWKLYVPTRIVLEREVTVAARPLARGQRLSHADMRLEKRDIGRVSADAVLDPERVVGYVVAHPLGAGSVLASRLLEAPRLVERGHRVRVSVEAAGVSISMGGTALDDGALGERIRVRNPRSRRVVGGIVVGPDRVRVRLPGAGPRAN